MYGFILVHFRHGDGCHGQHGNIGHHRVSASEASGTAECRGGGGDDC